jgi:hypothetical protein
MGRARVMRDLHLGGHPGELSSRMARAGMAIISPAAIQRAMYWRTRYVAWVVRRSLGLTPMQGVLKELVRRGIRVESLVALEVFGGSGTHHTKDYSSRLSSLEVWEIDHRKEAVLKRNLRGAKVKVTDSYREVKQTTGRYSFIVVDDPSGIYDGHVEHYDIFPNLFRICSDSSILIINVFPDFESSDLRSVPAVERDLILSKRKDFYKTDVPEFVAFEHMVETYKDIVESNGFYLEWYFFRKRPMWNIPQTSTVHYLTLKIKRRV